MGIEIEELLNENIYKVHENLLPHNLIEPLENDFVLENETLHLESNTEGLLDNFLKISSTDFKYNIKFLFFVENDKTDSNNNLDHDCEQTSNFIESIELDSIEKVPISFKKPSLTKSQPTDITSVNACSQIISCIDTNKVITEEKNLKNEEPAVGNNQICNSSPIVVENSRQENISSSTYNVALKILNS